MGNFVGGLTIGLTVGLIAAGPLGSALGFLYVKRGADGHRAE